MPTIRLTWNTVVGAVSYNIYSKETPGVSVALSPLVVNTTDTTYDHTGLTTGIKYYIVAAVGPNNEIGPPSEEIAVMAGAILTSIVVTPTNFSIHTPLQQQYTATGHYSDSSTQNITSSVTWDTSNHARATIDGYGLLTAISNGTANVTATLGLITGSTLVTVIGVSTLYLCADNLSGVTQPLTAEALFTDSTTLDITNTATWQTTNASVATVSSSGITTLVGTGSTNISVTYQSISKSLNFNVIVPTPTWQEELTSSLHFSHIQGFDDTHIWAASGFDGGNTTLYFSTGNGTWTPQTLPTNVSCNQIYAASATVVYIANNIGPSGVLVKTINGGSSWTASAISFSSFTVSYMSGIYGVGVNTLWAIVGVNENGNTYIIKSTNGGTSWTQDYVMSAYGNHVWANSSSDVWATDYLGNYYRWNGTAWSTGVIDAGQGFDGLWGTGPNNMYFGGFSLSAGPSKIYHWNGSSFTSQTTTPSLVSSNDWWIIYGNSGGTDIWATDFNYSTSDALVWRSQDGVTWSDGYTPPIHTTEQFIGLWRATSKVYIGSQSGTILSLDLNTALTVSPKLVKDFVISPTPTATVSVGHPTAFTATANYSDGTSSNVTTSVTWHSSNATAATIDAYGIATAVTQGQDTNITLTASNFECHYPTATDLTTIAPPSLLYIDAVFDSQLSSTTRQYTATGNYSDSSTLDLTNTASWYSTNTGVGTINASGVFTYVSGGSTDAYAQVVLPGPEWHEEDTSLAFSLWTYIWAADSTHVFVAHRGYVYFDDGTGKWATSWLVSSGDDPNAIWGTSPTNVFVSFGVGSIYQYNGTTWNLISGVSGLALHGTATNNIWTASGVTIRRSTDNGANWSVMYTATQNITGIFALSSSAVWFTGQTGLIVFYNGSIFTPTTITTENLYSVWATSTSNIYVGSGIGIYHSSNNTSYTTQLVTNNGYLGIYGTSTSDIWATGDTGVYHSNGGGTWVKDTNIPNPNDSRISVFALTTNNVYVGGYNIEHYTSLVRSNTITISLVDMWGSEANPAATMLGGFALTSTNLFINNSYVAPSKVLKSSGNGTWTDTSLGLSSNPTNTVGVWGTGSLVLIGGQGTTANAIIRSTDSGSTWNTVSNSFASQVWWIHGTSTSNIWAAGGTNILLKSIDSGATWSSVSFPGGFLEAVHAISTTDVWVGGDNASFTNGVLYHYNGTTFTSFFANLIDTPILISSIWASSTSDIYVMAQSTDYITKYIYHSTNSGSTFTLELKVFNSVANAFRPKIFGISSTSIYAAIGPAQLFRSNGSGTWTREYVEFPIGDGYGTGITNEIDALLGTDDSHVWAGGSSSTNFIIKRNSLLQIRPDLVSIVVSGATSISGTAQYMAIGTYSDTRQLVITSEVTWSSTNTSAATISNVMRTIGIATNVGVGSTNITATLGTISGFLTVSGSAAWTIFYDKANQPTSPATGYSTAPATGGNIATYTGLAKVGSTIVASNGVQSWFATAASGSGKYPFLTTTNNGSTFQVASWPLATDSNQALDGNSFYAPNIYATTDKFLVGCERNKTSNLTTSTDGLTWSTSVQLSPNSRAVAAFHSTSNSNIWAVSDTPTGSIYVWQSTDDGASWTAIASPISSGGSTYFPSVFTISSTDVWVAGATNGTNANPCVYHYNGSTWTDCSAALRTAKGGNFNALIIGIWASDTNNVYFIDANFGHNQLYRTTNQGTSFTVIDVDPANSRIFNAIAGTSSSNIYLAGYSGNIYHYNGSAWAKETLPSSPSYIATSDYLGLWIDGSTVYACGQNIIKK